MSAPSKRQLRVGPEDPNVDTDRACLGPSLASAVTSGASSAWASTTYAASWTVNLSLMSRTLPIIVESGYRSMRSAPKSSTASANRRSASLPASAWPRNALATS